MYCTKKITDELIWVGGNDRRLSMFEGVYSVPYGVSYNSYLLKSSETVLFDTVDKAVSKIFFENIAHELDGKNLDYVVVHHMEPDHSATLNELVLRYPNVKIICNSKIQVMLSQYFDTNFNIVVVKEGDALNIGGHELTFVNAPMVHWPEVMMTYDKTLKVLFSADAFGHFGALNGAIFSDEVDFEKDYLSEARRYYTNIVGKYGPQVQNALKKASTLDIDYICPLHGFVIRNNLSYLINKYELWSSYTPEEQGVMIAYASVYGNTENTAEIISTRLREKGIKTVMYDVSVTPASEIIAESFKYSHFVIASTTYNAGIFVQMENFLHDLVAHNIQNRTVAIVENGSWAPTSGKLIKELFEKCKGITFIEPTLSLRSALKVNQLTQIDEMVDAIESTFEKVEVVEQVNNTQIEENALFNLTYGLFVLTAKENSKDNGCIINTVTQVANIPNRIAISVNKNNYTHDIIKKTGAFNVSILTEEAPFKVFENFGFKSGREVNKFENCEVTVRSNNGIIYIPKYTNGYVSGKVVKMEDCGSHTLFIADIVEAKVLSDKPSLTYGYYFKNIKPNPVIDSSNGKKWVCKICGYVYDDEKESVKFENLPDDWVCPLCKHPKSDFELK